jgi:hypothetical protein
MLVFAFFLAGAGFETIAMRGQRMAITHAVVLGLEAITAFSLGVLFLKKAVRCPR